MRPLTPRPRPLVRFVRFGRRFFRLRSCLPGPLAVLALLGACDAPTTTPFPDATFDVDGRVPDAPAAPLGYVVRATWLVRGEAPTAARCDANRIARVRLRVLDADATVLDALEAECAEGAFEGTAVLPWGTRHYGAWAALADDGEVLEEIPVSMPITAAMPRAALDVVPASFEVRPAAWHDYAAGGVATVPGYPDSSACNTAGVAALSLTLTPTDGGEAVSATVPCDTGRAFVRTEPLLDYDRDYAVRWEARAPDGTIVSSRDLDPVRMSAPVRALFGLDARL